jgi:cell division protein FtsW (lipid II flippase)
MASAARAAAAPRGSWRAASPSRLGTGWEGAALLLLTIGLLSAGIVMVYSASAIMAQSQGLPDYYFVIRQATGGAMALVVLGVCAQVDYRRLRKWAWPLLFAVIALLLVTIAPGTSAFTRAAIAAALRIEIVVAPKPT